MKSYWLLKQVGRIVTIRHQRVNVCLNRHKWKGNIKTEHLIPMLVFWVTTPCRLVGKYRRFGGTNCLHFQFTRLYNPEDWHRHLHCRENVRSHMLCVILYKDVKMDLNGFQWGPMTCPHDGKYLGSITREKFLIRDPNSLARIVPLSATDGQSRS
jgi:hypothetical protein